MLCVNQRLLTFDAMRHSDCQMQSSIDMQNERTNMTKTVTDYKAELLAAIDARATYESSKSSDNTSMQSTLANIRKLVDHDAVASVMLASNVAPDFINRNERSNARYNVYAAEKVVNIARALASVATLNHYTRATLATANAISKSEHAVKTLSHKDAACACSQSVKHTDSKREAIIKHVRYAKHIAANTASTQSSSSINALQTFNVLNESRDASNAVCYSINADNVNAAQLVALATA